MLCASLVTIFSFSYTYRVAGRQHLLCIKKGSKNRDRETKGAKGDEKSHFEVLILSVFYYDLTTHHDWSPCLSLVLWWRNSMESLLDTFIFMITQLHYDDSLTININFRIEFKKFVFEIYFLSILKIEHILEL